jgi:hypothetical protein
MTRKPTQHEIIIMELALEAAEQSFLNMSKAQAQAREALNESHKILAEMKAEMSAKQPKRK